jgi:protein ImuA
MPAAHAAPATDTLRHLRETLARADVAGRPACGYALRLGVAPLDDTLGGGLVLGALHELSPAHPAHAGAAAGFAVALAVLGQAQSVLWIQSAFARAEAGALYGAGLDCFGLRMDRLVTLEVTRTGDVLWAMEEALKCRAATVVAELFDDTGAVDLTAMRRLSLAARAGGGLGLLLRHRPCSLPSAAATRWEASSSAGARDCYGGLGRTTFALSLTKNRYGPCGRWLLTWDHHACVFHCAALSLGMAEAARDRSDRALLRRAG